MKLSARLCGTDADLAVVVYKDHICWITIGRIQ
jgi:hypothetical protein